MSLQLLKKLNGNKNGELLKLINSFEKDGKEPEIAWYPSAGEDFNDIIFLSAAYNKKHSIENYKLKAPDIFIHTDSGPFPPLFDERFSCLKHMSALSYTDTIKIKHREHLPTLNLPLDNLIVCIPDSEVTNKVIFTILSVDSNKFGKWDIPLIYVVSENAAFANEIALPNNSKFRYIINIRYHPLGTSTGIWIKNILKRIGCKILITDNAYYKDDGSLYDGDQRIYELYPNLIPGDKYNPETTIRTSSKSQWDGFNVVCWISIS